MDAKEKAKELVEKFKDYAHRPQSYLIYAESDNRDWNNNAKKCALIAVENTIQALGSVWADVVARINRSCKDTLLNQQYWLQVKEEIEKL